MEKSLCPGLQAEISTSLSVDGRTVVIGSLWNEDSGKQSRHLRVLYQGTTVPHDDGKEDGTAKAGAGAKWSGDSSDIWNFDDVGAFYCSLSSR